MAMANYYTQNGHLVNFDPATLKPGDWAYGALSRGELSTTPPPPREVAQERVGGYKLIQGQGLREITSNGYRYVDPGAVTQKMLDSASSLESTGGFSSPESYKAYATTHYGWLPAGAPAPVFSGVPAPAGYGVIDNLITQQEKEAIDTETAQRIAIQTGGIKKALESGTPLTFLANVNGGLKSLSTEDKDWKQKLSSLMDEAAGSADWRNSEKFLGDMNALGKLKMDVINQGQVVGSLWGAPNSFSQGERSRYIKEWGTDDLVGLGNNLVMGGMSAKPTVWTSDNHSGGIMNVLNAVGAVINPLGHLIGTAVGNFASGKDLDIGSMLKQTALNYIGGQVGGLLSSGAPAPGLVETFGGATDAASSIGATGSAGVDVGLLSPAGSDAMNLAYGLPETSATGAPETAMNLYPENQTGYFTQSPPGMIDSGGALQGTGASVPGTLNQTIGQVSGALGNEGLATGDLLSGINSQYNFGSGLLEPAISTAGGAFTSPTALATEVSLADKLKNLPTSIENFVNKDPASAAKLGLGAIGLLNGAGASKTEDEQAYNPAPIDQSIADKYGRIPTSQAPRYQSFQSQPMQAFQSMNLPQGLLQQRLNRMRGLL